MGPTLGQRLRALRVERGLSQADLAGELVSPSYVSLIEAGKRSPEPDVLEGLAARLGCSATYLELGIAPEEINDQRLRLQFAEIALANGELAEAHERFSELSTQGSVETKQAARWGLARTEEAVGDLIAAVAQVEVLLDASRAGEAGVPGLLVLQRARCRLYKNAGDFGRSIEVGEIALREVRDLGLHGSEDEIKLASTLVGSYWARGDLVSAQQLASKVIEQAETLNSRTAQGSAYWNASLVAEARGQLPLALDLAASALALLAESTAQPAQSLAGMRVTYAWLLLRCDPPRLTEAGELLERAHMVYSDLGMAPYLASCEVEMARCALLRGDLVGAVTLADRAIARCLDAGAAQLLSASVISGLAKVMSGSADEGIEMVSKAAARLQEAGSRQEAAEAWRDLAETLIRSGKPDQAIGALRHAADCAGARASAMSAVPAVLAAADEPSVQVLIGGRPSGASRPPM